MSDLNLDELKRAVSLMTPGPWSACGAQPDGGCPCGLVWSRSKDAVVASVKLCCHCGDSVGNGADGAGIAALRNAADSLLSSASRVRVLEERVAQLEREASETNETLAQAADHWERLQASAYNVCGSCREPFSVDDGAMARHVRECPRSPAAVEIRALRKGIARVIDSLAEDELDVASMRRLGDSDDAIVLAETVSQAIADLRSLLAPSPPVTGEGPT